MVVVGRDRVLGAQPADVGEDLQQFDAGCQVMRAGPDHLLPGQAALQGIDRVAVVDRPVRAPAADHLAELVQDRRGFGSARGRRMVATTRVASRDLAVPPRQQSGPARNRGRAAEPWPAAWASALPQSSCRADGSGSGGATASPPRSCLAAGLTCSTRNLPPVCHSSTSTAASTAARSPGSISGHSCVTASAAIYPTATFRQACPGGLRQVGAPRLVCRCWTVPASSFRVWARRRR